MLEKLLQRILNDAEDDTEMLQIQVSGKIISGAVRKSSDYKGLYEVGYISNTNQGQSLVCFYFHPKDLTGIFVEKEKSTISRVSPGSGLIIPGES